MEDKTFDPAKYITKVSGRDYLEVKFRLLWLRTNEPNASIETEHVLLNDKHAVFKATITLPSGASASGYGSETPADFGDYIEKAETKAIGRALGALGFGTQFCDDHDFGGDQQRVVDSPVQFGRRDAQGSTDQPQRNGQTHAMLGEFNNRPQQAAPAEGQAPNPNVTVKQWNYLHGLGKQGGMDEEAVAQLFSDTVGTSILSASRKQVSEFIDYLKSGS